GLLARPSHRNQQPTSTTIPKGRCPDKCPGSVRTDDLRKRVFYPSLKGLLRGTTSAPSLEASSLGSLSLLPTRRVGSPSSARAASVAGIEAAPDTKLFVVHDRKASTQAEHRARGLVFLAGGGNPLLVVPVPPRKELAYPFCLCT